MLTLKVNDENQRDQAHEKDKTKTNKVKNVKSTIYVSAKNASFLIINNFSFEWQKLNDEFMPNIGLNYIKLPYL